MTRPTPPVPTIQVRAAPSEEDRVCDQRRLPDDHEVVLPRDLAQGVLQAVEALQVLTSDQMLQVAAAVGRRTRRRPGPPAPPCHACGVDVAVGLPHGESCPSDEAHRLRAPAVVPWSSDDVEDSRAARTG